MTSNFRRHVITLLFGVFATGVTLADNCGQFEEWDPGSYCEQRYAPQILQTVVITAQQPSNDWFYVGYANQWYVYAMSGRVPTNEELGKGMYAVIKDLVCMKSTETQEQWLIRATQTCVEKFPFQGVACYAMRSVFNGPAASGSMNPPPPKCPIG